MENAKFKLLKSLLFLCLVSFTSTLSASQATTNSLETYMVLVRKPDNSESMQPEELDTWYESFLPLDSTRERMVHSYRNVATGFAAKLTAEEATAVAGTEGVVSVGPRRILPLHTTRTPAFLGLRQNLGFWNSSSYGKGVIIGLLDTGIAPEHPSFDDQDMPPPPEKWKGKCEFNGPVKCNNKLIGARNFVANEAGTPPYDAFGHGTHTSSTAAGSPIRGANLFGQLNGTAIAIAPSAHLAMYKVCDDTGCSDTDILAAMDAAVEDGVDVLSLSLGGQSLPFFNDTIALGAFAAINKGIFASCSAGNSGPDSSTLSNEAPWILTVGASTVDRAVVASVILGNKEVVDGQSLYQPANFSSAVMLPLVYAGANGNASSALCTTGSLNSVDVKGKIVLCLRGVTTRVSKGQEVKDNGGAAMILMNDEISGYVTTPEYHVLPASHVSFVAGMAIQGYINSSSTPMATISFKGTVVGLPNAPLVAMFSSRGPSMASPGILKPDIIGPGVQILAAWPESIDNSTNPPLNMISGTSMSCPHLAGVAALIKHSHPDWSPAAIRSAIMTTANIYTSGGNYITDQQFNYASVFDIGAGHVSPSRANDPGMVYDIQPDDYIPYLCGLDYTDEEVGLIVQRQVHCSNITKIPEAQLNYPSFAITLGSTPQTYTRTVTNVGGADAVYVSKVIMTNGVNATVSPSTIAFKGVNQKVTFSVTFSRSGNSTGHFSEGYLYWISNDMWTVRSPIAVVFP